MPRKKTKQTVTHSAPNTAQRGRLAVHSHLREHLAALIEEYGQERVAFAMEGLLDEWRRDDARAALARARAAFTSKEAA